MEATYGQTQAAYGGNEDESLLVRFFKHPQENQAKSEEAGRPIFEETEYIEIMTPGDKGNVVCRPVREHDKGRFPRHWDAYQKRTGDDESIEGTLLEEWPQVTRSQVEELKFYHVRTVEQLAAISDVNAQNMRGVATLKQKAAKFLDSAMSNEELSKKLAAQEKQIAELIAAAEAAAPMPTEEKPKRKRRTKAEMEADAAA